MGPEARREAGTPPPTGYAEWPAPPILRRYVACTWTGGSDAAAHPDAEPVLPDGCMDLIWTGTGVIVSGPDTGPSRTGAGGPPAVGLRFRPGMAPLFLGVPAHELRDQRADLESFWPDAAGMLDELAACLDPRAAAAVLGDRVAGRLPGIGAPDPLIEAATALWSDGAPDPPSALARRAGITERQLHRRSLAAVGYGPKLLQRVLRFQAFLAACRDPGSSLSELAARVGYADQSHLSREARALATLTPAQLRAARTDVRNVQDPAGPRRVQRCGDT